MKAGRFQCVQVGDELKLVTISQVLVGKDKDHLMIISATQSVFNVCEEFGKYISLWWKLMSKQVGVHFRA